MSEPRINESARRELEAMAGAWRADLGATADGCAADLERFLSRCITEPHDKYAGKAPHESAGWKP